MELIDNTIALKQKIALLEDKRRLQEDALKQEVGRAVEFLKPGNLIKTGIKDLFNSPHLKHGLLDTGIGLAAGLLAKKAVTGATKNPIKKILGTVLQSFVAGQVSEHAEPVREAILKKLREFLTKTEKQPE